jgi:hypothetical protein
MSSEYEEWTKDQIPPHVKARRQMYFGHIIKVLKV